MGFSINRYNINLNNSIMTIKPLTQRLFGKENIRQIVREWLEEQKTKDLGDKRRFTEEIIEHNIEWFEALFMKSLRKFVTDTRSFYITTVCYNNILNRKEDSLTEEYIALLQYRVKNLFLGAINEKEHTLNKKFDSYLCLETVEGLFYAGEVYKHFRFWGDKGIYGHRVDGTGKKIEDREEFCLVPQEGNKHLIIPEEWKESFIKVENYARPELKVA